MSYPALLGSPYYTVHFQKLSTYAVTPRRTETGFELSCPLHGFIPPHSNLFVDTRIGICSMPRGLQAHFKDVDCNLGLFLVNGAVIARDSPNNARVNVVNYTDKFLVLSPGQPLCTMVFVRCEEVALQEVRILPRLHPPPPAAWTSPYPRRRTTSSVPESRENDLDEDDDDDDDDHDSCGPPSYSPRPYALLSPDVPPPPRLDIRSDRDPAAYSPTSPLYGHAAPERNPPPKPPATHPKLEVQKPVYRPIPRYFRPTTPEGPPPPSPAQSPPLLPPLIPLPEGPPPPDTPVRAPKKKLKKETTREQ